MRRRHDHHLVLLAVFMAACLLLPCCVSAAHTAEHACSHYDDCRLCQQFEAGRSLSLWVSALLSGCIFVRIRMQVPQEVGRAVAGFVQKSCPGSFSFVFGGKALSKTSASASSTQ